MRYRTLAWLPIALALPVLFVELAMGPSREGVITLRVEVEVAKLLWLIAALAAARAFEPGDYLRRGWLFLGASSALFMVRDATLLPAFAAGSGDAIQVLRGLVVLAGNAMQIAGIWTVARVWSAVGLDDHNDVSRSQGRALLAASIALSVGLTGASLLHDTESLAKGNLEALPHVVSDLGDAIAFVLIGPMLRVALALRGGVVFWTWSLLAASQVSWMLFDGARSFTELYGSPASVAPFVECLRVVGIAYLCAAGMAQRWIVSGRGSHAVAVTSSRGAAL